MDNGDMSSLNLKRAPWVIAFALIVIGGLLLNLRLVNIYEFSGATGTFYPDYAAWATESGPLQIGLKLWHTDFSPTTLHVYADDCLEELKINGLQVDLGGRSQGARCDYARGLELDLGEYIVPGENMFDILVENGGGSGGILITNPSGDLWIYLFGGVFLAGIVYFIWLVLKKLSWPVALRMLVVGALLLRLLYVFYTPLEARSHDLDGHLEYINYITLYGSLPLPSDCWECHQPPLYYLFSAVVVRGFDIFTTVDPYLGLRLVSVVFSMVLVVTGIAALRLWLKNKHHWQFLAGFLFAFWPAAIVHSASVNNDMLWYALWGLGWFGLSWWWFHPHRRLGLDVAVAAAILAALAKTSGALLVGIVLAGIWGKKIFHKSKDVSWVMAIGLAFVMGAALLLPHLNKLNQADDALLGQTNLTREELFVGSELYQFVGFDFGAYLQRPFTNPFSDEAGRKYVWNYFFKTGLFGQFEYQAPWVEQLAVMMSVVSLPLLAIVFLQALISWRRLWLPVLGLLASILVIVPMRYSHDIPPMGDFRYVLPVIWYFAFFLAEFGYHLPKAGQLIIKGMILLFAGGSIAFFLSLYVAAL